MPSQCSWIFYFIWGRASVILSSHMSRPPDSLIQDVNDKAKSCKWQVRLGGVQDAMQSKEGDGGGTRLAASAAAAAGDARHSAQLALLHGASRFIRGCAPFLHAPQEATLKRPAAHPLPLPLPAGIPLHLNNSATSNNSPALAHPPIASM